MPTITYGDDITIDTDALPVESLTALVSRGVNHVFGNECAAKVTAGIRKAVITGTDRKADDVTRAEIESYRKGHEADVAAMLSEARATALDAIMAGKLGQMARGARFVGVDKVMRDVAREIIFAAAAKKGVARPKGEALSALVEKYIAKNGDSVKAEAERRMAATVESDEDLDALLGDEE